MCKMLLWMLTTYFWCEFGCLLSLSLIGCCVCFQGHGVMSRASSQCLVAGLLTVAKDSQEGRHRLLLVAGPLEVAMSLRQF